MINNIYLKQLRNGEFNQFFKQILAFVKAANPSELGLQDQYDALEKEWELLENLFKKESGSDVTEKIQDMDLHRDQMISGLKSLFEAYTYHYDEKLASAGKLLLASVEKYGNRITKQNYQEESSILSGIIKNWNQDEVALSALASVQAMEWKEELQKANLQFDELYRLRTVDLSETPDASFTSLKEPVIAAYAQLISHLSAHATLSADKAPYESLIGVLNQHIEQFQTLINQRKKVTVETDQI
ncbi:MAG: DUF6261 family protein [Reichenbachiella sp.]